MTSQVNVSVPSSPTAYTRDIRRNFEIISAEISAIQAYIAANQNNANPQFTGTMQAQSAAFSGNVDIAGALTVQPVSTQIPSIVTNVGTLTNVTGPLTFTKLINGMVYVTGKITFDYTNMDTQASPGSGENIVAAAGLNPEFRPSINTPLIIGSTSGFFMFLWVKTDGSLNLGWGLDRTSSNSTVTGSGHVCVINHSYKV